ncbi:MAG: acyltransferase [Butyrivibrio sp.]|nr:acyltransferase [Butyrivibrio sp.]
MGSVGEINVKKRNASFELLRIIAMLMILNLHYNSHADVLLQLGVPASGVQIYATIIEAISITGVNVYVLLSGFFLSKGKVRPSRILQLICQVYFYTILVSVAMMLVGTYVIHSNDSVYKIVQYLFPISSEHYWFVTAYIIMYVMAPVMNAATEVLSRKQMRAVIAGLLIWFSIVKSFVPVMFATDHYGYDYGWFIVLYLIAAYIRKYDVVLFFNAKKSAAVFLLSVALMAFASIALHYINLQRGGLVYFSDVPFHLNFIFSLTGSLGLFSFFRFYKMRDNRFADVVRFVAPFTFGVYLLHMHLEIKDRWLGWLENLMGEVPKDSVILFAWHQLRAILIVFVAGIFVDWIRKTIFDYVGRVLHNTRLFKRIRQWDEDLC